MTSINGKDYKDGPFDAVPLLEEAPKALRHIIEEELRALPLAERIDRILCLTAAPKSEPVIAIRRRQVRDTRGHCEVTMFVAVVDGHESGVQTTIDEAVTTLGASVLEKLERQAAGLREAIDQLEAKIQTVRGKR